MIAEPIQAGVRARGVAPAWALYTVVFLVLSLLVGLGVGAVGISPGSIVVSALAHVPLLHVHSSLDSVQNAIHGIDGEVSIIFDHLSGMLASSTKETYSFLKQCVELVVQNNSSGLFLLCPGAARKEVLAAIRSLFSVQIHRTLEGLKLTKLGARY